MRYAICITRKVNEVMTSTMIKQMVTLGPASSSPQIIAELVQIGVRIFRLNTSHGSRKDIQSAINIIRSLSTVDTPLACFLDLQGPKIRLGSFAPRQVSFDEQLIFSSELSAEGNDYSIPVTYNNLSRDVHVGQKLLIDDGRLTFVIEKISDGHIYTRCLSDGVLLSGKGLNCEGGGLNTGALTSEDLHWIDYSLEKQIDFIGVSFVRDVHDIKLVHERCSGHKSRPHIIAKIERAEAIGNLSEIVACADGVMVARGDLAIEVGYENVPMLQKAIIQSAKDHCKPVIVATQMLESMMGSRTPTRAEVNDVACAVMDGATCVMLSAETATGKYPLEAAKMLVKVCARVESSFHHMNSDMPSTAMSQREYAILAAVKAISGVRGVRGIVVMTETGNMARLVSSQVSHLPIFGLSAESAVCRRMGFYHGCLAYEFDLHQNHNWEAHVWQIVTRHMEMDEGDMIVVTKGSLNAAHTKTNQVQLLKWSEAQEVGQ